MILEGLSCIQTNPLDRPPMSKVVDMLEGSLESLQIPPKAFLFSCSGSQHDFSSTIRYFSFFKTTVERRLKEISSGQGTCSTPNQDTDDNPDLAFAGGACPSAFLNDSAVGSYFSPFEYASDTLSFTLFYGCPFIVSYHSGGSYCYYANDTRNSLYLTADSVGSIVPNQNTSQCHGAILIPVRPSSVHLSTDYILRNGFDVTYAGSYQSDCVNCTNSGGSCGYSGNSRWYTSDTNLSIFTVIQQSLIARATITFVLSFEDYIAENTEKAAQFRKDNHISFSECCCWPVACWKEIFKEGFIVMYGGGSSHLVKEHVLLPIKIPITIHVCLSYISTYQGYTIQCGGSLDKVLKWYRWIAMYPTLKKLVDDMGFEEFCSINAGNSDNRLIHVLVERWWPSTHTFHFSYGELVFILLGFVMLTGISFGMGRELPYGERYSKLEEAEKMFLEITSSYIRYGNITLAYLKKRKQPLNPRLHNYDLEMNIVYTRAFIAYMMGNLFFSNGVTSLLAGYLAALTDCDIFGAPGFDWGTPIMAALYRGIDEVSVLRDGKVKKLITGFYALLEFWFFKYCRVGMYLVKVLAINPSKGKSCFSAEHPEGSIGVSPIRSQYALVFRRPVYASDDRATNDPRDMGWFMDMAGPNDQRRRIPIPMMLVPYPCPPTYSTDELWHQNHRLRYAAYEDSRQYDDHTTELEEQLRRMDEII
ncbi:hypothetical protein GIB67_002961 [Kingdonia uniflora]|uniref:Uncharacterized protein n=1 Tax=Kingdonia uniflora TaxID=39325 RepID=A0A7J7M8U6_9MAGN|nr:hypothetical protein GIB67_002961 [Kingdonia uniflora]